MGRENWKKVFNRNKLPVVRKMGTRDVMYNVTTANALEDMWGSC